MRATLAHTMLAVAARRHLAAVDLRHAIERLGPRLRDDTGAQAAEYAMPRMVRWRCDARDSMPASAAVRQGSWPAECDAV